MRSRDLADYVFLALIWGLSFLFLLQTVASFGWVGVVSLRCLIAAMAVWLIARLQGYCLHFNVRWQPLAVVGATTVAGQLLMLSYAMPLIGTAMAAICCACTPLMAMLMSRVIWQERLSASAGAGLALGAVGIVFLVGFPVHPFTTDFAWGCIIALASALCAAFGSSYASVHLRHVGHRESTLGTFLLGGLMSLPLLVFVPLPTVPDWMDWGRLLVLAVFMSAVAYMRYFRLVGNIGAPRAISVEFASTAVAVAVGAVLLGERLSLPQWGGSIAITLGCALVLGFIHLPVSSVRQHV